MTFNHLPDELLLEIFDSYRQRIGYKWRKKYVWFNLAHVSKKWRAVMFTSSSRLDLGIIVGPKKPAHIKTLLSGPWPILLDFNFTRIFDNVTGSAIWRMRAALEHHPDRVRKISFEGSGANLYKFFKAANRPFPMLEGLELYFADGYKTNLPGQKLPDTFLRGPDLSDLPLQSLRLDRATLASISRFLSSATYLTVLVLNIDTVFGSSPEKSLPECLRGMTCLRRLVLTISPNPEPLQSPSQPSTPKAVPLSELTSFRFRGPSVFLDALVARILAPFLWDVDIWFIDKILPSISPIVHLPRFIDEIQEHYYAAHLDFQYLEFLGLSLSSAQSDSKCIGGHQPIFTLKCDGCHPTVSITHLTGALSTRLTIVEELRVSLPEDDVCNDNDLWRWLYRQFLSVKVLRTEDADGACRVARTLCQGHGEPVDFTILPALEEIDLGLEQPTYLNQNESLRLLESFRQSASARQ